MNYSQKLPRQIKPAAAFLWVFYLFLILICFSIAQTLPVVAIFATILACLMFMVPFLGRLDSLEGRLIVSGISFAVFITAFYPPFIGFFMALEGSSNSLLVKLLLGLRSAFYAGLIGFSFAVLVLRKRISFGYSKLALIIVMMVYGFLAGAAMLEIKMTYLINSFLPLFFTLAIIPYVIMNGREFTSYSRYIEKVVIVIGVICLIYFPILMMNLDVFRPDLALMHQSTEGRGLEGALPPQWQSLIYGVFVPRFVGIFPNPIIFGYFCAIAAYIFYSKRRICVSFFFIFLMLLSMSKGAWLLLLTAHAFRIALMRGRLIFWGALFFITSVELILSFILDGSNRVHVQGLIGGIQSVLNAPVINKLFGFGMGTGGNLARSQLEGGPTSLGWLESGSESGIGVLIYQLGFAGLLFLLFLLIEIFRAVKTINIVARSVAAAIGGLCAAWLSNMLFQEDLINVTISSQVLLAILLLSAGDKIVQSKRSHSFRVGENRPQENKLRNS